jgi:ATP-dependent RNA helicase DDX41
MAPRVCVLLMLNFLVLTSLVGQEERQYAIKSFKSGAKDVMVASGVASKGLDFNDIQHVIIFSMPKEIEDYVHQIGRTGRSGKTGIATTFVNMNTPEQTLLDLKYLLMEAGQKWVIFSNRSECRTLI